MSQRLYSLRWRLIVRLALIQAVVVLAMIASVMSVMWRVGWIADDKLVPTIAATLIHDDGQFQRTTTPEFERLERRYPDLWFIAEDTQGRILSYGEIPPMFAQGEGGNPPTFGRIRIWGPDGKGPPQAYFQKLHRQDGFVNVVAGVKGNSDAAAFLRAIGTVTLVFTLPLIALTSLALLLATSLVVRGSFRELEAIVGQARQITIADPGLRLPDAVGPVEIQPLVVAVNDALDRMDEGYARRARFLTDAAHELRTPIAILQTRLDGMPRTEDLQRLRRDVARLAAMAEQMLDLQRLEADIQPLQSVDLVTLARNVASDMAPFVKASGGDLSLELGVASTVVSGDASALERALGSLVHNAVEHGGPHLVIRVLPRVLEVWDDGVGIPEDERDRIFEPFYRRAARSTGAGLGLSLVQRVARIHGGRASAGGSHAEGTTMRIEFPSRPVGASPSRSSSQDG